MKKIIAFDFDGTLTKQDSFICFIIHCKGLLFFILIAPILFLLWSLSYFNLISSHSAKQYVFSFIFKGMPLETFNGYCNTFIERIDTILYNGVLEKIKEYKNENAIIIIVSASIENWIIPWAKKLEIDNVISTKIQVDNQNKLTGLFKTKNCVNHEKVTRLLEKYPNRKEYYLTAFGNSKGDTELLAFADLKQWNYFKKYK